MEHVGQTLRLVSRELRYRIIIRTKISLKDEIGESTFIPKAGPKYETKNISKCDRNGLHPRD